MRHVLLFSALLVILGGSALALAGPQDEVAAATQGWAEAFNSRDPERVLALYDQEAVFWGTMSPTLRDTPETIGDYFKDLPKTPQGRVMLGEQRIRVYGNMAINTGLYTFTNVRDGEPVTTLARFSFTYRQRDGRWLIVDHHSSALPAPRQ
jgi:uncharacterized protein (TIGR02246 family)